MRGVRAGFPGRSRRFEKKFRGGTRREAGPYIRKEARARSGARVSLEPLELVEERRDLLLAHLAAVVLGAALVGADVLIDRVASDLAAGRRDRVVLFLEALVLDGADFIERERREARGEVGQRRELAPRAGLVELAGREGVLARRVGGGRRRRGRERSRGRRCGGARLRGGARGDGLLLSAGSPKVEEHDDEEHGQGEADGEDGFHVPWCASSSVRRVAGEKRGARTFAG